MAFKDYSTNPSENTELEGPIYVGPNMFRDDVRPALQQIAADGRDVYNELLTRIASVPAGPPGDVGRVANRTALAALVGTTTNTTRFLSEGGREGLFVFDDSDLSAEVTADTAQGIYVAPAAAATGASGAWVRQFNGSVNVKWFGAIADGATNDGAAFLAALALLKQHRTGSGYGYGRGTPTLHIPAGVYNLGSNTLDMTGFSPIIEGESPGGFGGSGGTVLLWDAGVTGIRVQYSNTVGATGDGGSEIGSTSTIIRNLTLYGTFSGTESEAHGIHLRGHAVIRDVFIANFAGDGIYAKTSVGAAGLGYLGAANGSEITNVTCQGCRNGIYLEEADSNAFAISNPLLAANRRYGLWSKTTVGNNIFGGVNASNGMVAGFPTVVSHSGRWFYVLPNQEAGAATNSPPASATNNTWWGYLPGAGGVTSVTPAWFNGITGLRAGGAGRLESSYDQWGFFGHYAEQDQPPFQIQASVQAIVLSPMLTASMFDGNQYPALLYGDGAGFKINGGKLKVGDQTTRGMIQLNANADEFVRMTSTAGDGAHWIIGGGYLVLNASSGAQIFGIEIATGRLIRVDVTTDYKHSGTKILGAQGAAIPDLSTTATSGSLPTPNGTVTIANAATPTVAELLEYCVELEAKLETLLSRLRASTGHGLIA